MKDDLLYVDHIREAVNRILYYRYIFTDEFSSILIRNNAFDPSYLSIL